MDEPRQRQEGPEIEATAPLPVTKAPEPGSRAEDQAPVVIHEEPEPRERAPEPEYGERSPEPKFRERVVEPLLEEDFSAGDTVFPRLDRDVANRFTVGDGFRFGCGFVLALAIGTLAFLVVMTAFLAVGTLMGFKLPF